LNINKGGNMNFEEELMDILAKTIAGLKDLVK